MILVGLGFKASAAPFHMWTPDVYEGAPTSVTAFMSAATKTAALVLTLRVLYTAFPQEARLWTVAVAVIACASLAVGNLAALVQRNLKRLLAYSSISHAGFILIAVAAHNALGGSRAPLLPDPVLGDVDRRVRRRRRPRTRARTGGDARQPRRDGLGTPAPRRGDVDVHARLRRPAADRRLPRQVLRLLRRVRARLALARDRRNRRDRRQPLLLPGRDPGALHAARAPSSSSPPAASRHATCCCSWACSPASRSPSARSSPSSR